MANPDLYPVTLGTTGNIKEWSTLITKIIDESFELDDSNFDLLIEHVQHLFEIEERPNGDQIVQFFEKVRTTNSNRNKSYQLETKPFHELFHESLFAAVMNGEIGKEIWKLPSPMYVKIIKEVLTKMEEYETEEQQREYCNSNLAKFVANVLVPTKVHRHLSSLSGGPRRVAPLHSPTKEIQKLIQKLRRIQKNAIRMKKSRKHTSRIKEYKKILELHQKYHKHPPVDIETGLYRAEQTAKWRAESRISLLIKHKLI